jgi:hypothetical protein
MCAQCDQYYVIYGNLCVDDTDGDLTRNEIDTDDDADGVLDTKEVDGSSIGKDCTLLKDCDNDGVDDNRDAFPLDHTEFADSDGDGVGNNADAFPDDLNESVDSDQDGIGDNSDTYPNDRDNDGVDDNVDALPDDPYNSVDSDGDGVGDNTDAFPDDPNEWVDSDNDGVGNNADDFPYNGAEQTDTDGDGVGNNQDSDDDDDGVEDSLDAFPLDSSKACLAVVGTSGDFAANEKRVLKCEGDYVGGGEATCTNGAIVKSWECVSKNDLSDPTKKADAVGKIKAGIMKPGKKTSYAPGARETARKAAKSARKEQMRAVIEAGLDWKDLVIEDTDFEGFTNDLLDKIGSRKIKSRMVPKDQNEAITFSLGTKAAGDTPDSPFESIDLDEGASVDIQISGESAVVKFSYVAEDEYELKCNDDAAVTKIPGDEFVCDGRTWYVSSLSTDTGCVAHASPVNNVCQCNTGYAGSDTNDDGEVDACLVDTDGDSVADADDDDDDDDGVTDVREVTDGTDPLKAGEFLECSKLEEAEDASGYIEEQCCSC